MGRTTKKNGKDSSQLLASVKPTTELKLEQDRQKPIYRRGVLISSTITNDPGTTIPVQSKSSDESKENHQPYETIHSDKQKTPGPCSPFVESSQSGIGSTEFTNNREEKSQVDPKMSSQNDHVHVSSSRKPSQKDFVTGFALLEACETNNEREVKDLVKKMGCMSSAEVGPLVNFQDQGGRTALSFACAIGNTTIIEELSKLRRLDPNLCDNEGNAPLHYAAQAGQSIAIDLLLLRFEGVIEPNCRNSTGLTPLHKAALQGRSRVAKSLIGAGASPHIRDYSRNLTAMEWARLCGRHICAEVIIRAARDNQSSSVESPPNNFCHRGHFPTSQSAMELKRLNSDDSPFYHLQNARNTISGANWLKNKIKKAIGGSGSSPSSGSIPRSETTMGFGLVSNLSGATLCAGSLILPSIKPLIDQQKPKGHLKMKIPTVQVTQVKR